MVEINLDRFNLWLHQVVLDAQMKNGDGLKGDTATLEWMRDRFARSLQKTDVTRIDTTLNDLRGYANDENFKEAIATARELMEVLDEAADRAL